MREKTLKALLPARKARKALNVEIKDKLEKMKTLKLRWVAEGLPYTTKPTIP